MCARARRGCFESGNEKPRPTSREPDSFCGAALLSVALVQIEKPNPGKDAMVGPPWADNPSAASEDTGEMKELRDMPSYL